MTGFLESEESAQISAMIHPINVQPASMFKIRMEVKSGLLRARNAGRKYRNSETSQKMGWK